MKLIERIRNYARTGTLSEVMLILNNNCFKKDTICQMDDIDDTNIPWDWDHIYPDSGVYYMKNCEQIIREWNG